MAKLKDLAKMPERLAGGHRLCPGCGAPNIFRLAMRAAGPNSVIGIATGCVEVSTTIYPYSAWKNSFIHSAFENSAATISGVEAAYKALRRRGKLDKEFKFMAAGGDGGTYDIGLQSLSGALERGHNMVYLCYDNEAYQNTGNQRSSSTPMGANTTTSPVGNVSYGRVGERKDLTAIVAAHHIPYVAQSTGFHWNDLYKKLEKAFAVEGPAFLNVLSPCVPGWKYPMEKTMHYSQVAFETNFWPLYEIENGVYIINKIPKERLPIEEWLKGQGRFRHLFIPKNRHVIEKLQAEVDKRWDELLVRAGKK